VNVPAMMFWSFMAGMFVGWAGGNSAAGFFVMPVAFCLLLAGSFVIG